MHIILTAIDFLAEHYERRKVKLLTQILTKSTYSTISENGLNKNSMADEEKSRTYFIFVNSYIRSVSTTVMYLLEGTRKVTIYAGMQGIGLLKNKLNHENAYIGSIDVLYI